MLTIVCLVFMLLLSTGSVLASDISAALFTGTVRATNSGSAAGPLTAVFSLNSTALKSAYGIDDSWDYVAMRTSAGADAYYMPAPPASSTWGVFIESIAASGSKDSVLYSGNASLSSTKYIFPGEAGISVQDTATLEMGNEFSVNITSPYLNTDTEAWAWSKPNAFGIMTGSGNVTANIYDGTPTTSSALRPTAAGDETNLTPLSGTNYGSNGDNNDGTYVYTTSTSYVRDIYTTANHTTENGPISSVTFSYRIKTATWAQYAYAKPVFKINGTVYEGTEQSEGDNAAFHTKTQEYTTNPDTGVPWTWDDIDSAQIGVTLKGTGGVQAQCADIWLTVNYQSAADIALTTTANVTAGLYGSLTVYADTTNLYIDVDGSNEASVALGGTSVPDTDSDIIFGESGATFFFQQIDVTVSGSPAASWEWEWATTLADSVNSIVATPSWISEGNDPDVTAALVNFSPINQAQSISTGSENWPELYTSAPSEPETAYSENTSPGLFFAPPLNSLLDMAGIPRSFFWYNFAFFIIIIGGIVTHRMHPSILLQFGVMLVLMIFFALPGINVYGMFTTIYFSLFSFGIIVMSRSYGL